MGKLSAVKQFPARRKTYRKAALYLGRLELLNFFLFWETRRAGEMVWGSAPSPGIDIRERFSLSLSAPLPPFLSLRHTCI